MAGELYNPKQRQMILADLYEYILLGRGYYSINKREDKEKFTKGTLHFINLLMSYESLTVSPRIRKRFLAKLSSKVEGIKQEGQFLELFRHQGRIGLTRSETQGSPGLNRYFDKMLPKTAGGLWHELLVYIFLLRNNLGYIVPLLLTQRFLSRDSHIVPPDFLIITDDKHIYGLEVGIKKEIQSGSFSLKTSIPTATVDTINSRCSDRCPICKKWIHLCPFVIENFSNYDYPIEKIEVKCLITCNIFPRAQILNGECQYSKYSRNRIQKAHTHHGYTNGYHYHYHCVLNSVLETTKEAIIAAEDITAIKTHFPYYTGLESLEK